MMNAQIFYSLLYFLIAILNAFLLQSAVRTLIGVSEKRFRRLLLFFACMMLAHVTIFFGDFLNILPVFTCFLFVIFYTCEGSIYKKTAITLLFFSTMISFNALRDNYLRNSFLRKIDYLSDPLLKEALVQKSTLICYVSTFPFLLFLFLETRIFAPDPDYELSDSMWLLLILLTMPPVCTVFCLVLLYDISFWNPYPYHYHQDYAALLIISIFSSIGLLWTITVLTRQRKLEQQRVLADINRQYYETLDQQYFEIRRLKHDMVNHLQTLSALPPTEQPRYFDDLISNPTFTQTLHYCGDTTVNAVLTIKENQLNHYGIQLAHSIDIPGELPFEPTDICALFANALDNAAEACRETEKQDKVITLESKTQKGLFCLKIINPVGDSARKISFHASGTALQSRPFGMPATTKRDKRGHGLGLKSIQEIVTRYQGEMELKSENGMAELFLYLPVYGR